ncbi:MAG: N-acetylmuramoyl-L-alanine amidase [Pseudomonadota bacterium]
MIRLDEPVPARIRSTLMLLLLGLALSSCGPYQVIEVTSTNQSSRVDYIVIHFTSETFDESMRLLTEPSDYPVSSHYLIPETGDQTYALGAPVIHRLVPELRRAWHAGKSYWGGADSLNDRSIGIELVNTSRCSPEDPNADSLVPIDAVCHFEPFDPRQIELLVTLLEDLLRRYPDIDPVDIVAHSDIAPQRKSDPGPLFPWRQLHEAGIGAWYDGEVRARYLERFGATPPPVSDVRAALGAYGYDIEPTGALDVAARKVVRAFQMHFTPDNLTGDIDAMTAATLFALLDRYRPEALQSFLQTENESEESGTER